ncbi:right-handed parallel beta-helix repeat-containing protein [Desulfococcaceae bacterium HSG8]|nr:right-handed parallel beta-helix repeat-containing protein [Desulfococcaceae bacterium HSG8]
MKTRIFLNLAVVLALMVWLGFITKLQADTVTNTNDTGAGSLRQAIIDTASGGTVDFSTLITLPATITLNPEIDIQNKKLTITGPTTGNLSLTGNSCRVFNIRGAASNVTISDITIKDSNNTSGGYGGGMQINTSAKVTMTNCIFYNNTSSQGGGIYLNNNASVNLNNCTFTENKQGGGMRFRVGTKATIENCTFENNESLYNGGGLHFESNTEATITNCTFSGNRNKAASGRDGGGIYNHGDLTIENCTFSNNDGRGGGSELLGKGGGIFNLNGKLTIKNSTFSNNYGRGGGGIYLQNGSVDLANCTFKQNNSTYGGGGLRVQLGTATITNCTFSKNTDTGFGGGGLCVWQINPASPSIATIANCTFSENTATGFPGGGIYNDGGTVNIKNTIVANNSAGTEPDFAGTINTDDTNIIGSNPLLGPLALYNGGTTECYSLLEGSPAINAAVSGPATDQCGTSRPRRTAATDPTPHYDIGAYEALVLAKPQSISLDLSSKTYGDSSFTGATASSGLPVSLTSSDTSVATVSGSAINIVGAGSTEICAYQGGNTFWYPANACGTLTVGKKSLTITAADKSKPYGAANPSFTMSYEGWVGGDNVSVLDTPPVASCSATETSNASPPSYSIIASGGDDDDYTFIYVSGALTITKLGQTITTPGFTPSLPSAINVGDTFTMTATASSGLTVSFASQDPSVARVSGTTLTITDPGTTSICASQPGNVNYNQAPEVCSASFIVNAPPAITEASPKATMDEDGFPRAFALTLHAADPDDEDSSISWSVSSPAGHGTASASGTGASKAIRYTPETNWSGRDTFEVKVSDNSGGSSSVTVTVTVSPVNDAPILDTTLTPALTAIDEDVDPSENTGTTVSDILSDNSITDPDGAPRKAVAVVAADNTNGVWQYSTDSGSSWTDFSDIRSREVYMKENARLLEGSDKIRFLPDPDYPGGDCIGPCPDGTATFTFQAWDKSEGIPGETADASRNGGITPFSSAADDAEITVHAIDDPPFVAEPIPDISVKEDSPPDMIDLDAVFDDVDNDDSLIEEEVGNHSESNVGPQTEIGLLPLTISGNTLKVVYHENQYGEAIIAITATSNGKTVTDEFTVTVQSAEDAPELPIHQFPLLTSIEEDEFDSSGDTVADLTQGLFLTSTGFIADRDTIHDPDIADPITAVAVTEVNNKFGRWQYSTGTDKNGNDVWKDFSGTLGQVVLMDGNARLLDADDKIRFVPLKDYYGSASFTFRAWDQSQGRQPGSTADTTQHGGGNPFSAAEDYAVVKILSVDDSLRVAANPINDIIVPKNAGKLTIDLSSVFTDDDSDISAYVENNTNTSLVTTAAKNNILTLTFEPDQYGVASITILAESGEKIVRHTFRVEVENRETDVDQIPLLTSVEEDDTANNGNTIAEIFKDGAIVDEKTHPVTAIVVTWVNNQYGTWQYCLMPPETGDEERSEEDQEDEDKILNIPGDCWKNFTETRGPGIDLKEKSRLLDSHHRIRFLPDSDYYGDTTFRFKAWDKTSGTPGATADTEDTESLIKVPINEAELTVYPVDDPPRAVNPIPDMMVSIHTMADIEPVDLLDVFTDVDSGTDYITTELESNTNPDIVTAIVEEDILTLDFNDRSHGKTVITVSATSSGKTGTDEFTVMINTAPELDPNKSPMLNAIDEDPEINDGTKISDIIPQGAITDPDGSPTKAIIVTAVENTDGVWEYSSDGGNMWHDFISKEGFAELGDNARLLEENHRIRFIPHPDYNGTAEFTFRAWDRSLGTAGKTAGEALLEPGDDNGGAAPFSKDADSAEISVNPVDDPLVVAHPISDVLASDDTLTHRIDLGNVFSDIDNETILKDIAKNTNPDLVTAFIDDDDMLILDFETDLHGEADITVRGTAGGKTADASFTAGLRWSNYAPELDTGSDPWLFSIYEGEFENMGTAVTDLIANITVTDEDDGPVNGIAVTGVDNGNGIWQYSTDNGVRWNDFTPELGRFGDTETGAMLFDGTLAGHETQLIRFVPNPGFFGIATFEFRAWDKSSGLPGQTADTTFNGGKTAFSSAEEKAAIRVNQVYPCAEGIDPGDVDASGTIDLRDLILAFRLLTGLNAESVCVYADVDGDKKIGHGEIVYILTYLD